MCTLRNQSPKSVGLNLVLGGTGKTGRRIAAGLQAKGVPIRIGSRSASPSFDWNNEAGWDACLARLNNKLWGMTWLIPKKNSSRKRTKSANADDAANAKRKRAAFAT